MPPGREQLGPTDLLCKPGFDLLDQPVLAILQQHLTAYPDAYIYHYNHYETTALKRLACRYATAEHQLDDLLISPLPIGQIDEQTAVFQVHITTVMPFRFE